MLNTYFAGYTFTTPPPSAPFGDLDRDAFHAPGLEQWDFAVREFRSMSGSRSSSNRRFSTF
jgi:hypothetical protein